MRFAEASEYYDKHVIVRDGVALRLFSHRGVHALRIEVDGYVGPVQVGG